MNVANLKLRDEVIFKNCSHGIINMMRTFDDAYLIGFQDAVLPIKPVVLYLADGQQAWMRNLGNIEPVMDDVLTIVGKA